MEFFDADEMSTEAQVSELEITIEQAKAAVDLGLAAEKLYANPEFQKLIVEGYFLHEAARMANLYGDPRLGDNDRAMLQREMVGPSALKRYLSLMVQRGFAASNEIEQAREAMFELMTDTKVEEGV